jgi:hypothetical protein
MIRWAARLFLLRILPRRLVPFLTVLELAMLARGILRGRRAAQDAAPSSGRASGEQRLPPWREFGRPASAEPTGPMEAPQSPRQVGPGAGATVRR